MEEKEYNVEVVDGNTICYHPDGKQIFRLLADNFTEQQLDAVMEVYKLAVISGVVSAYVKIDNFVCEDMKKLNSMIGE